MADKITQQQFAASIKEKYPEYADVDDATLAAAVIEKYPEYKDQVSAPTSYESPTDTAGAPVYSGISTNEAVQPETVTAQVGVSNQTDINSDYVNSDDRLAMGILAQYNDSQQTTEEDLVQATNAAQESKAERFAKYDNQSFRTNELMEVILGDDYEEYQQYRQTGEIVANSGEIAQEANNISFLRGEEVLDDLPDKIRRQVNETLKANAPTDIEGSTTKVIDHIDSIDEKYLDSYRGLYKQRAALEAAGEDTTEVSDKLQLLNRRRGTEYADAFEELDKLGDIKQSLDLFGRSYQFEDKLGNTIERVSLGLGQFALDLVDVLDYPFKEAVRIYGDYKGWSPEVIEAAFDVTSIGSDAVGNLTFFKEARKFIQDAAISNEDFAAHGLERPQSLDTAFDSLENFFEWTGETIITQSPYLLLAIAGGPAAIPLFFATGAGEKSLEYAVKDKKYNPERQKELRSELDGLEWGTDEYNKVANELTEVNKHLRISFSARAMNILSYGAAEAVFERLGTISILKKIRAITKSAKELGKDAVLTKIIKEKFGTYAIPKAFVNEAATEAATTVAQNWSDVVFGQEDKSLMEGVEESAAAGGLIGLLLGGGGVLSNKVAGVLATHEDVAQATRLRDKYVTARYELEKNKNANHLSETEVEALNTIVSEIETSTGVLETLAKTRIENIPEATLFEVFKLDQTARRLHKQLGIIDENLKLNDKTKDLLKLQTQGALDAVKEDINAIVQQKLTSSEKKTLDTLGNAKPEAINDLSDKLNRRIKLLKQSLKVVEAAVKKGGTDEIIKENIDYFNEAIALAENAYEKVETEQINRLEKLAEKEQRKIDKAKTKAEGTTKKSGTDLIKQKLEREGKTEEKESKTEEQEFKTDEKVPESTPKEESTEEVSEPTIKEKLVKKAKDVLGITKVEAEQEELDKNIISDLEHQTKQLPVKGKKTKKKSKSEASKASVAKGYQKRIKGKNSIDRKIDKLTKKSERMKAAGEKTEAITQELEQQKKRQADNEKLGKIAEARIDLHNANIDKKREKESENVKIIADNINGGNIDDVVDDIVEDSQDDDGGTDPIILFLSLGTHIEKNESLSKEEKALLKEKLNTKKIKDKILGRLNELRKQVVNQPGIDNRLVKYQRIAQKIDAIEAEEQLIATAKKLAKSEKITEKEAENRLRLEKQRQQSLSEASEADIEAFKFYVTDKVVEAQKNTKVWNNRKGGDARFLYTLIPAAALSKVLFEAGIRDAQGSTANAIDHKVAEAIVDLLEDATIKEQVEANLQKYKDEKPNDLGRQALTLESFIPTRPKDWKKHIYGKERSNKAGTKKYDQNITDENLQVKEYKKQMAKLGRFGMRALFGVGGLLTPGHGFGRTIGNGIISIDPDNSTVTNELLKALKSLGTLTNEKPGVAPTLVNNSHISIRLAKKDLSHKKVDSKNIAKSAIDYTRHTFYVTIKDEVAFDQDFEVTIDDVAYKGLEGFYTLFRRPGGFKPGRSDAKQRGVAGEVVGNPQTSLASTYQIKDGDTFKAVLRGSQMIESKTEFHTEEVKFKKGSNQKINGKKPIANTDRSFGDPADETAQILSRASAVKLTLDPRVSNQILKMFLEGHKQYTYEGKGYEESVKDLLKTEMAAGLFAAFEQIDSDVEGFFIQHFLDWRTRLYSGATVLNYQGIKPFLAMFRMGEKKPLGQNGLQAILVQAADEFNGKGVGGLKGDSSKLMHERDRLAWALENFEMLVKFARNPPSSWSDEQVKSGELSDIQKIWKEADSPELLLNTALELSDIADHLAEGGDVASFESNLIVWQDATVSGGQHNALLSRDRYTAGLVNTLTNDERFDLYTKVGNLVFIGDGTNKNPGIQKLAYSDTQNNYVYIDANGKEQIYDEFYDNETIANLQKFEADKYLPKSAKLNRDQWNAKSTRENQEAIMAMVNGEEFSRLAEVYWGLPSKRKMMRTLAKGPVMTSFYNAGAWAMMDNLLSKIKTDDAFKDLSDTGIFGKKKYTTEAKDGVDDVNQYDEADAEGLRQALVYWLTIKMHKATTDIAVGPNKVKSFLGDLVKKISKDYFEKDGSTAAFVAVGPFNKEKIIQRYMKTVFDAESISYDIPNSTFNSLRQGEKITGTINTEFRRDFDKDEVAIAPNLTHWLDAQLVAWEALHGGRDFLTIHDNFGTHASDARQQGSDLRSAMGQMYSGNMMHYIIEQALGRVAPKKVVDEWKTLWDVEQKAIDVINSERTGEEYRTMGSSTNSNWDTQEELENNPWAISGAPGNLIGVRDSYIDDQDKNIYKMMNDPEFRKNGKVSNKQLLAFEKTANLKCKK